MFQSEFKFQFDGLNLNLGSGKQRIPGCVHIDVEPSCEPDIVLDFVHNPLPYKDGEVDRIFLFHVIEHISESFHFKLLSEFHRVLKPEGSVTIAYPEFVKCAQNYITNYKGQKDFWKHTIYGLQRYPSDFHVSLMDTEAFSRLLADAGFENIQARPEVGEPYNTIITATKGVPTPGYEDVLRRELFSGDF
jgi:predicted SAM-dependent methyltransferase